MDLVRGCVLMRKMSSMKTNGERDNKAPCMARSVNESVKSSLKYKDYSKAAINSLEDELIVIDRDCCIIQANEAVLLKHGKRRSEVIGKHCYDIAHGQPELCRSPRHECPLKTVWETGKPARVTHRHVYNVKGERRERYLDIIASPVKDSQGNIIAVTELIRDITEAKETESKIIEAQRNLLALNTIATAVSQSLDPDTVLYRAIEKTLEIMSRNTGGILLWDEERKKLCYRVHNGLSKEYAHAVCFLPGEGIVGRVAQSGEAILVDDISIDPRAANPSLIAEEGLRAFAAVPLQVKDKVLGVLTIASHDARKFSAEDIQLLESIASQIAIAVENARLHQEVQRKDESRGELLGEIFSIQEEERRRIARELHDETSQSLASLAASLEAVAGILPTAADEARIRLKKVGQVAVNVLDEVHKLIYELRPTLLDDLGLVAAARWLTDNNLGAASVSVNFKTAGRVRRLPPKLETTLFRVIQEAVSNIAKHAHAKNADVVLHFKKEAIIVHVEDDGEGFDVEEAISSKDRPRGLGLLGMRERVELMKGTLSIRSRHGSGTEVDIEIPMNYEVSSG
jgi:PAS domain S-box-containing protein